MKYFYSTTKGLVFVGTFFIGVLLFSAYLSLSAKWRAGEEFDTKAVAEPMDEVRVSAVIPFSQPPIYDPTKDYAKLLPVKLLFTGALHSEEVPKRNGDEWVGLFRVGDGYELKKTDVYVRPTEGDQLFDSEIHTSIDHEALFLLRGANDLPLGPVLTVRDSERDGEFDFSRTAFGIGHSFLWLWTENTHGNGTLGKGSSLLMQYDGMEQKLLRSLPNGCDDCMLSLKWVGDLDGDSNPDFLIDVTDHYNRSSYVLYLHSKGVYAAFSGVGC